MPIPESSGDYSAWDEDPSEPQESEVVPPDTAAAIELTADSSATGQRLDKWLAEHLRSYSRNLLQRWIEEGAVRVNDAAATLRQPVWPGDRIRVEPRPGAQQTAFTPEAMALAIVHEDAAILVINKPAGLVVHPAAGNWSGTLLNGLLHHAPALAGVPRAGIVHRLDKDTTGLMVVAKTIEAQTDLVRQLQERTVRREYLALVWGNPPSSGAIDAPIGRHPRDRTRMAAFKAGHPGAKEARTHFRVLARTVLAGGRSERPLALICCRLETGRTHQIRVHMQSLGYPLVGDAVYGAPADGLGFGRQALHAWRLGLIHPATHAACQWQVAPPDEFTRLLEHLDLEIADAR